MTRLVQAATPIDGSNIACWTDNTDHTSIIAQSGQAPGAAKIGFHEETDLDYVAPTPTSPDGDWIHKLIDQTPVATEFGDRIGLHRTGWSVF